MGRQLGAALFTLVLVASACAGADDPSIATGLGESLEQTVAVPTSSGSLEKEAAPEGLQFSSPDGDAVISYELPAGECRGCRFIITFGSSGTARYVANDVVVEVDFEVDELDVLVASSSRDDLVVAADDCRREVDGNAPILWLLDEPIDTCYDRIDDDHPLVRFVSSTLTRARAAAPTLVQVRAGDLDDPWQFESLRLAGAVLEWPTTIDPGVCPTGTADIALDLGSAWLATASEGEVCRLWLGGETENPSYDGLPTIFCQLPAGHLPIEVHVDGGGPAWVWSDWCDFDVALPGAEIPSLDQFVRSPLCAGRIVAVTEDERFFLELAPPLPIDELSPGIHRWTGSILFGERLASAACAGDDDASVTRRAWLIESAAVEVIEVGVGAAGPVIEVGDVYLTVTSTKDPIGSVTIRSGVDR